MSNEVIAIEQRVTSNAPEVFQASAAAASQYKDALAQTSATSAEAATGFNNLVASMQAQGASSKEITDAMKALGLSGKEINEALSGTAQSAKAVGEAAQSTAQQVNNEAKAEQEKTAIAQQEAKALGEVVGILTVMQSTLNQVNSSQQTSNTATNQTNQTFNQAAQTLNQFNVELNETINITNNYNTTINNIAPAHNQANNAMQGMSSAMREGRLLMAAMAVDMALLTIAAGEQMPQAMREGAKGIDLVIQGAMMGQMAVPGVGAAIGALAGGLLALGSAAATVDPEIAALNKDLESLAKHDDAAAGLAKLTGVTQYDAEMALEWAKTHKDAADQLSNLTHEAQTGIPVLQGIGDAIRTVGEVVGGVAKAINDAVPQIRAYTQAWGEFIQHEQMGIAGFNALVDALAHGKSVQDAWAANVAAQVDVLTNHAAAIRADADAVRQLSAAEQQASVQAERSKDLKQINADIVSDNQARFNALNSLAEAHTQLVAQTAQQELQLNRSLNEELASLSDQRAARETANTQEIARANQQETDAIAGANRSMNEALARSDQELRDSLAKAAQSLADKESDISRSLADKEADIAHQRATAYQSIDDQIATQRQELADKLLEIARNENEQEAALAWNTHSQLQAAKTDNEKENILERAQFEASQIRERAGDQRSDAQKRFDEEKQLAAQKKELADQDFAYRIALAEREAAERRSDAQRSYTEQVALDQQRYAEQVALEHQRNADAIADAQRRNTEEQAQIAQRLAAEEHAIDQQEARAKQRAKDQEADLTARVKQQSDAINQRYDDENRRIDETAAKNAAAHHELVALSKTTDAAYQSLMASMQAASGAANAGMVANATTSASGIEAVEHRVLDVIAGTTQRIRAQGADIETWMTATTGALGTIADVITTKIGDVWNELTKGMNGFTLPTITLPGRAAGGPVAAGHSYMVGENGPERFTASQDGYITPNNQISNSYVSHNGGNTFHITIHDATDPKKVWAAFERELAQHGYR
jgi:hypothetical protein